MDIEGEDYYLKPMNCPHHHMIYGHSQHSYRQLPLRLAEPGLVHRFERSGVLTGIIRARCFTQNDSHIYCAKKDLKQELIGVMSLFQEVYEEFRIKDYWYRLSLPDFSNAEKYGDIGNKEMWDEAGRIAEEVMKELGVKYVVGAGEASFYGPKIDVQIKNVLGKEDTIATAQIDFYSAGRFDLEFVNESGEKEKPVIIHRAIMGSFERFLAFLLEQTAGNFPTWLAPVQAIVLPIGERQSEYAGKVTAELKASGVRVELDASSESLGKRIRSAKLTKVPYILVLGDKEVEDNFVTVEKRGSEEKGQPMPLADFITKISDEISKRAS
jgi:threonyl-tRNA synthetase